MPASTDDKTQFQPLLRYKLLRPATEHDYSAYRCAGQVGCGERVTYDVLGEHAAKQHNVYDYHVGTVLDGQ